MSQETMLALARQVVRDLSAQGRIESMSDDELAEAGLDDDEIGSIRDGFLDRMLRLGVPLDDWTPAAGCRAP